MVIVSKLIELLREQTSVIFYGQPVTKDYLSLDEVLNFSYLY